MGNISKRICVFCGSSLGNKEIYETAARSLAKELVRRHIVLVYGGGNIGLMGVIAEEVIAGGGEVIGIIPQFLADKEFAHESISTLHVVESMHERKALMDRESDGFIAMPGGLGTLEEYCEMLTWKQLQLHHKPCGLLNIDGFFDALIGFVDHQVQEGFVSKENRDLIMEAKDVQTLVDQIEREWNTRSEWR
ncbi:MAG: TIGR00730 family Rossman fold protein [Nitrospirae bacterium]|nr:TIGR00730 family Rossman fold protein [Nitrospirota bacterium]